MKKLSNKQMLDLLIVCGVWFTYLLNQRFKNEVIIPFIGYFLRCHFNDFLAGFAIPAYVSFVLSISKFHINKLSLRTIMSLVAVCSIVWEGIAPIFLKRSIPDFFDIIAYLSGGFLYWYVLTLKTKKRTD